MRAAAVLLEADAGAMRRTCKCGFDIAIGLIELDQQIAFPAAMDERRANAQRRPAIRHRRQRLVIDDHLRGRILGDVARRGDHDRHRFADIGDLVPRQHKRRDVGRQLRRAELQRQPHVGQQRRKIIEREHRVHARRSARSAGVDAADQGMRVRAAHERGFQHAGKIQVIDEAAMPGEKRTVLDPLDRPADGARLRYDCSHCSKRRCTRAMLSAHHS